MNRHVTEEYSPRSVSNLENWDVGPLKLKVYSIRAKEQFLTDQMVEDAYNFAKSDVPSRVAVAGDDNGLGFAIIHPGDVGISILIHWWIQGSVLCQHIRRTLWGADAPMDTDARPVVACVWELGLINAEQVIWRDTMMSHAPDPMAYLDTRATIKEV